MLYTLTKLAATVPSPNFATGRSGNTVRAIVVHKAEGSKDATVAWFQNPSSQVSAHYVVDLDGSVVNMANPDDTAWHAGVVADPTAEAYADKTNPNAYTIGIELAGFAAHGTPTKQIAGLVDLLVDLCRQYTLEPSEYTIEFHRDYDKQKACPGPWLNRRVLIDLVREQFLQVAVAKLPLVP